MAVALKCVLTYFVLMDGSHVHVNQDMYCILMASLALVSEPNNKVIMYLLMFFV